MTDPAIFSKLLKDFINFRSYVSLYLYPSLFSDFNAHSIISLSILSNNIEYVKYNIQLFKSK